MSREVAPGQVWAHRDDRHEGWRYLTVRSVEGRYVHATSKRRKTRILADRFGRGSRWSYCGHEGPGVLPPYTDKPFSAGCLSNVAEPVASLDLVCAVGFGVVVVTRDDAIVWQGEDETLTLAHFEKQAAATPGDWRARFVSAMSELMYQRQGEGRWVLVFRGMGFA